MKLDQLLKKITPLPWSSDGLLMPSDAGEIYSNHAANVLPGLVEASNKLKKQLGDIIDSFDAADEFERALARADEVKVEE